MISKMTEKSQYWRQVLRKGGLIKAKVAIPHVISFKVKSLRPTNRRNKEQIITFILPSVALHILEGSVLLEINNFSRKPAIKGLNI